jgi:hypothetical protein
MAFVPAPNIVQVQLFMTFAGQQIENRWNIDVLEVPTATDVRNVAESIFDWCNAHYRVVTTGDVTFRSVLATDLTTANGVQHEVIFPSNTLGEVDGPSMPNEVTLAVALKSASRGRSANGRSFIASLARSLVVANNVDATFAGLVVAAFQALIDLEVANGWQLVIVSYVANKVPRPGGPVYFPVLTAKVTDLVVDSQRRRKPGNGA